MTLLTIDNLTIHFNAPPVVRDMLLSVERGQIVAIVGESGSGKSLTAHSILKLLPTNAHVSGTIHFSPSPHRGEDGRGADAMCSPEANASNCPPPNLPPLGGGTIDLLTATESQMTALRGNRIGMIFQEPMTALNPLHTIARQIIEPYCIHHKIKRTSPQAQQKLAQLLDDVGLTHLRDRGTLYPHQLSGGERQRAMIAMAIANDPDLLIADEPTTALDVTLQRQILALLKKLQTERNMGMLFITHDLPMVRAFADRVYVMRDARVMEAGTIDEIFHNPYHPYTKELLASAPQGTAAPVRAAAPEILRTEHLSVTFPIKTGILRRTTSAVAAVKNVSLTLRAGETLGIVGESGSGKSSLGLAILRLIDSTGPIVFLGTHLDQLPRDQIRPMRANMQLVFQDPYGSLNPRMTVGELIAEGLLVHGIKTHETETPSLRGAEGAAATHLNLSHWERSKSPSAISGEGSSAGQDGLPRSARNDEIDTAVTAILHQVGLTPDIKTRYPHEFSGGQRQRIAIARAMILKPKLVVLDEPTSALDMTVQKQVLELLKDLQKTHDVSYLFISHDLRVIRSVAHQVLVLKNGDVVEHAQAEQLFTQPQHPYTQALLAASFAD